MKKVNEFNPSIDFYWLFFFSVLLFCLVIIVFYRQANPEWKKYQQEFKNYLEKNISHESAEAFEISVKQIWLPELGRVDRCISCHVGYDNPNLVVAPQPFTAHPDIKPHVIQMTGCTSCHGGQGFALKKQDAHGEIEYWSEPVLGQTLAQKYGFANTNVLMQIKCNICHRREDETAGLEMINRGKKLLTQKRKCQTCHIINGVGGKTGPDLTFVGDKHPERFDFSKIENEILENGKPLSMLIWHFEHFKNPRKVVPESKMLNQDYTDEEAWSLAMLMMSWKNINLPIMLVPKEKKSEPPKIGRGERTLEEWGKKLFDEKSCSECHRIGGGVEVGPDLLGVTKRRQIEWIRKMILHPKEMEQTDPVVKELYKKYEEVGMDIEQLTEDEAEAVIKYLEFADKKEN